MRVLWAAAVAAALLLAGCGSPSTRPASSGGSPGLLAGKPASAANRASADREAAHLLTLARLPTGSRLLTAPPPALVHPTGGTPAVTSLVDRSRYWQVPAGFTNTVRWLRAHPPAGLTPAGSSSTSGRTAHTVGYSYAAAGTAAWTQPQLQLGVATLGAHRSAVRADAMVIWLDPRPYPDSAPGPRLRVTVRGGCPQQAGAAVGVANSGPGLDQALVPPGSPTAGLVCRYPGSGSGARPLAGSTVLTGSTAASLAAALRAVPLAHPDGAATSCPADTGSASVFALTYPGRTDVDLYFTTTGCPSLSNGHLRAPAASFKLPAAAR